jgi:N-acetylglucosaminyl-diphospho-decaprenol L-rhamnosyltransferase
MERQSGNVSGSALLDVTAAIVNFNTRDQLARCLDSLQHEGLRHIVVVDNASTDDSVAVAGRYSSVQVIANTTNVGYGAAANQAISVANGRFVLLLNADTEVRRGSVSVLAKYLETHPEVAIAAPRLRYADDTFQYSCFPFPGTFGWLLENEPLSLWTRHVPFARERSVTFRTSDEPRAVPWALGAALLLRRDQVLEAGGFEESYFMYFEEVDLSYRLAGAGWSTHVVPAAVVMHEGGASTSQVRPSMLIQRFRSTLAYHHRHSTGLRQLCWTTLLRVRWSSWLLRDSLLLLVTFDPLAHERLRVERSAWWAALFDRPVITQRLASGRGDGPVASDTGRGA